MHDAGEFTTGATNRLGVAVGAQLEFSLLWFHVRLTGQRRLSLSLTLKGET